MQSLATQLRALTLQLPTKTEPDPKRDRLDRALAIAAKLLEDVANPKAGDRLTSAVDPDARTGKPGDFFVGYLVDVAIDPESELITAINVLPGNGPEAADAVALMQMEETAQGNKVEALSIDGAGFNGAVLRELADPAGLNLELMVPPPQAAERKTFGPERFSLTVIEVEGAVDGKTKGALTCPAGETTQQRERHEKDTGYRYRFKTSQCSACPLRQACLENPASKKGRRVMKNDYEAEYKKVIAKAATPEYHEARRVQPRIERKLGELARHHHLRRTRYQGQEKVRTQAVLTALVVNIKRMVRLITKTVPDATTTIPVRAEPATT